MVVARGAAPTLLLVAASRVEGRLLAELTRPSAILVDAALAEEAGAELALAAATWGADLVALGGDRPPAGFNGAIEASAAALGAWLQEQVPRALPEPAADDALALVRARYAGSLGDKARALADGVARALADELSPAERDELRRLAHRLRGSAGTYGFPAFGEVAATIDDALRAGVVEVPEVALGRAAELLGPWLGESEPLAVAWPALSVEATPAMIGELARIAQRARVQVVAAPSEGPSIARVVEVEGDPAASELRGRGLRIGADEALEGAPEAEPFPRRELAARLPGLLADWSATAAAASAST